MAKSALRYPYSVPVAGNYLEGPDAPTGRMDYLKIQRYRINFDVEGGYGGENLPTNKTVRKLDPSVVYLNMPQSVTTNYSSGYSTSNLGAGGVLATQLVGQLGGASQGRAIQGDVIKKQLESAVAAALPEFAYSLAAKAVNQMGGLGHDAANAGTLQALSSGRIMNPFTEQTFTGTGFRSHSFSFKMFARNKTEAQEILAIILYLKKGVMPKYGQADFEAIENMISSLQGAASGSNSDNSNEDQNSTDEATEKSEEGSIQLDNFKNGAAYLEIPDRFLLEFVRLDTATDSISSLPHYRFHPCVCTNFTVNYTPDGQYVSFKDAIVDLSLNKTTPKQMFVPAVEISMDFQETRIITQNDIEAGY